MATLFVDQTPQPVNITIKQGQTWQLNFVYKDPSGNPIDLTGGTAILQVRTAALAKTTVLSLTLGNGLTIPTPTNGTVVMNATPTQTAAIANAKYEWDCKYTSAGGQAVFLGKGTLTVEPQVSR